MPLFTIMAAKRGLGAEGTLAHATVDLNRVSGDSAVSGSRQLVILAL